MSSPGNTPNPFTAEQEKMYEEMNEKSEYHRREDEKYQQRLKYYRDWKNVIATAAQEAEVKGRAEGHEKGLVEGHEKGLVEGETKKALETATKLLQKKMSLSDIAEVTGLSEEEINALRQ